MRMVGTGLPQGGAGMPVEAGVMGQLEEICGAVEESGQSLKDVYQAIDQVEGLLQENARLQQIQIEETRALHATTRDLILAVERVITALANRPV